MDYYRRYIGDYLAKTLDLKLAEDGAYSRLLDHYYAKEKALPGDFEKVCEIARVRRAADRRAVKLVLDQHFTLEADGLYHNARADKELGIAVPKIEKLREVARENGKKGGRPKKPKPVSDANQIGLSDKTGSGSGEKPEAVSTEKQPARVNQPPTASHHPEPNLSDHRFPGVGDTETAARTAAAEDQPRPDAIAVIIAECRRAKVEDATADNAIVTRWAATATPGQVGRALTEARSHGSKPFPQMLRCGYVDAIVKRIVQADHEARAVNEAKIERTRAMLAESGAAKDTTSLMPDAVRKYVPKQRVTSEE